MNRRINEFISKIDELISRIGPIKSSWYSDIAGSGFKMNAEYEAVMTEAISLIETIYGRGTPHYQRILHFYNEGHLHALKKVEGLLIGTKRNIESGILDELTSLILIDIKKDFLETAATLLEESQKDPAAVLACIVLEDSLKRLAKRSGVEDAQDKEMGITARKLLAAKVIEKSTNQSIQSFKNLRNAALHAQWDEVSAESVNQLLAFLPIFFEKHRL